MRVHKPHSSRQSHPHRAATTALKKADSFKASRKVVKARQRFHCPVATLACGTTIALSVHVLTQDDFIVEYMPPTEPPSHSTPPSWYTHDPRRGSNCQIRNSSSRLSDNVCVRLQRLVDLAARTADFLDNLWCRADKFDDLFRRTPNECLGIQQLGQILQNGLEEVILLDALDQVIVYIIVSSIIWTCSHGIGGIPSPRVLTTFAASCEWTRICSCASCRDLPLATMAI